MIISKLNFCWIEKNNFNFFLGATYENPYS